MVEWHVLMKCVLHLSPVVNSHKGQLPMNVVSPLTQAVETCASTQKVKPLTVAYVGIIIGSFDWLW